MAVTVENRRTYDDNVITHLDERCWDAEQHEAVSTATVAYGGKRPTKTQFTRLCIFCNLRLETWTELEDGT